MFPARLLAGLLGLCCVSALMGQDTYYVNGVGAVGNSSITYQGNFTLNTPQIQAVADQLVNVQNAILQHGNMLVGSLGTIATTAVQMQQIAATTAQNLAGFQTELQQFSAALTASANAAQTASTTASGAANTLAGAANQMTAAITAFTAGAGGLGTTIQTSVGTAAATAHFDADQIKAKLDGIKDVLLTNDLATNSFTINTTNGGLSLTNSINVNVPSLANTETMANESLIGKAAALMTHGFFNTNYTSIRDSAVASSPWGNLSIPTAFAFEAPTVPDDFMRFSWPKPDGTGEWVVSLNPMTHMPSFVTAFRAAMSWAMLVPFLIYCGKVAYDASHNLGTANQTKSPDISILGNNGGSIVGVAYVAIFLVAVGVLALAMTQIVDVALFSKLADNPLSGFGTDALILANMFLPIGQAITQAVLMVSARWVVVAQTWVFNVCLRLLLA